MSGDFTSQFDSLCDEFEKHWEAVQLPSIETFLNRVHGESVGELLYELIQIELWWLQHAPDTAEAEEGLQEAWSNIDENERELLPEVVKTRMTVTPLVAQEQAP